MRLLKLLDQYFEEALAGFALCVVMGLLMLQIILRYFLGTGFTWTTEVVRVTFVWFVYLGAALGVQRQGHIRITSFLRILPSHRLRRLTVLVADGCWLAFNVAVVWYSIQMLIRFSQFSQRTPVLGIDIFWVYSVIPFCFALMCLRLVQLYLRDGWHSVDAVIGVDDRGRT